MQDLHNIKYLTCKLFLKQLPVSPVRPQPSSQAQHCFLGNVSKHKCFHTNCKSRNINLNKTLRNFHLSFNSNFFVFTKYVQTQIYCSTDLLK